MKSIRQRAARTTPDAMNTESASAIMSGDTLARWSTTRPQSRPRIESHPSPTPIPIPSASLPYVSAARFKYDSFYVELTFPPSFPRRRESTGAGRSSHRL